MLFYPQAVSLICLHVRLHVQHVQYTVTITAVLLIVRRYFLASYTELVCRVQWTDASNCCRGGNTALLVSSGPCHLQRWLERQG